MIAEVIIETSVKTLNKTFDYEIPENLEVFVGSRVFVPFGRKKEPEEGIVVGIKENSAFEVKEILGLQEEQIDKDYIDLAIWMSKRYFCNVADSLKLMLPPGRTVKKLDSRIKEKTVNAISLAKTVEEIRLDLDNDKIKTPRQRDVLEFLINNDNSTMQDIELFTDATPAVVAALQKKGYIEKNPVQVDRNPFKGRKIEKTTDLKLNAEQEKAFKEIKETGEYLLYGVTGSGKTEIYMQEIEKVLKRGKTSIMLVPEISLTPQTVSRFVARFGEEQIAVLHSKLSVGERFDEWNKIKKGNAKIVIGARSAIFAPAKDLGLIIIDEEHDESYMSESNPRYDAIEIAEYLIKNKDIPLILGSATPDLRTFYRAKNGEIKLLTLTKRANESSLPEVEIVDLRDELTHGNKSMISRRLKEEIEKNLKDKKQTILFLNRRGFSNFIMCRDCGHTLKCKRCDISLTYHKYEDILKCHYCGFEEKVPSICPVCGSKNIKYFGTGTQKLEEEVKSIFKDATTIRIDADTVTKKNSHEEILTKFKDENIDILIGTQMVVKGHHFPNVTLVGVIAADGELNIGDFRASEKTFQILTQVSGRAGREKDKGRVIIQTYNPDHYAIEYSKKQDYDAFYDVEVGIRKALKYPPFCDIMLIDMSAKDGRELTRVSKHLHEYLKKRVIDEKFGLLLYSPVVSPIGKIKDRYRMRIIIKCKYDEKVQDLIKGMLDEFYKMKVTSTRVQAELNPNNML